MPFPTTGILDDANRPNEDPLSQAGEWTTVSGVTAWRVTSNTLRLGTIWATSYRTTFSKADAEAYVTVAAFDGPLRLYLRLVDNGAQSPIRDANKDGYFGNFSSTGWIIYKGVGGVGETSLSGAVQQFPGGEFPIGSKVGIQMIGARIGVWYKRDSGSAWTEVGSVVDTTFTAAGTIAIQSGGTGWVIDDLGGGEVNLGQVGQTVNTISGWGAC